MSTLIVCALESETNRLMGDLNVLYTGVGKVNSAYHFTKEITKRRPTKVIDIGTCGSSVYPAGSVVCCTSFVQRDMDNTPIGFAPYETAFSSDPPLLQYGEPVAGLEACCCGSGDNFDTSHSKDHPWQVVEMEAYVIALICRREGIPFQCLKYVSDGADGMAAQTWDKALEDGAAKLNAVLRKIL